MDQYCKNYAILVVEDNFSFGLELSMMIEEAGYDLAGCIHEPEKALEAIHRTQPDLVLMDIQLGNNFNGIELAAQLEPLGIPILFITSVNKSDEYQLAKQLRNFVGYLVKPIFKYSIISSIEMAEQLMEKNADTTSIDNYLYIKNNKALQKVDIRDIQFIEVQNELSFINLETQKITLMKPLTFFEESLPADDFLRTHRSFIVNLNKITAIDYSKYRLFLGGYEIPFSRRNKKVLQDRF